MTAALAVAALALPATATAQDHYVPLIVGGQEATELYPWMGSLQLRNHPATGEPGFHTCGAVLISPSRAATAAHCVSSPSPGGAEARDPGLLQLRVGSPHRGEGGTVHLVRSIELHPDWAFQPGGDLAVVHLATPVIGVEPVRLGSGDGSADAERRVLGWGVTGGGQPAPGDSSRNPDMVRQQDADLVGDKRCAAGASVPGAEHCVTDADGEVSGVCFGDSGGPLVRREPGGRWELEGLASRGTAEPDCGTAPAVFTDTTGVHRQWITTH